MHNHESTSLGSTPPRPASAAAALSRRRLVAGGAWTVPVIAAAVAAPLAAASGEPVDGAIAIVGTQSPFVDCNLRNAPLCVKLTARLGAIPVGTAVTLSFDPGLIDVAFTDDNVAASGSDGVLTALLTTEIPAGTSLNIHIRVTRAAAKGGVQRSYIDGVDTRGWSWGCWTTDLDASLQVRPSETRTSDNSARRVITVR